MGSKVLSAEIAVVGAGPAGIAAATRAAEAGRDVLLLDDGAAPGGQVWKRRHARRPPRGARRWMARFERSGARLLAGVQVVFAAEGRLLAETIAPEISPPRGLSSGMIEVGAQTIVVATGARERFLPFPGWTLPGVFGVGAAQSLAKSGVSFRGKRVVVAGSGPLLLPAAASLAAGGAKVATVAEQAPRRAVLGFALGLAGRPGKLLQAALYRSRFFAVRYRAGVWVEEARGRDIVREAVLTDGKRSWAERCDVLCCGYGLVPNLELPMLLGCAADAGGVAVDELQRSSVPGVVCAGEATGIGGVELALVEGEIAGLAAAGRLEEARRLFGKRLRLASFAAALERTFALRPELKALARPDTILCRCEDVPFGVFNAAWTRRQAKLYTRAGMGPCQGRVCGPALEFLFGWGADSIRVPLKPTPLSSFLSFAGAQAPEERRRTR